MTGGTWTVDQPLVAQVGVEANVARVTALGSGQATLTLTRDGLSAEAIVTVLAAGTVAPEGTVLWESAPLGEPSVKRGQVLQANRADDGDAGYRPGPEAVRSLALGSGQIMYSLHTTDGGLHSGPRRFMLVGTR